MKKYFTGILLGLLFLTQSANAAFAHTLATDGSIGAILHIDPDDDPIVGQEANFFFSFKDKEQRFSLTNCDCQVRIQENGVLRDEFPVTTTQFSYTFNEKNVYQISIAGTPRDGVSFQPFTLHYDIRVSRDAVTKPLLSQSTILYHILHYGIFGVGFVVVILLIYKENKRQALFKKK